MKEKITKLIFLNSMGVDITSAVTLIHAKYNLIHAIYKLIHAIHNLIHAIYSSKITDFALKK